MPPPPGVTPDFYGGSYVQNTLIIVFSTTFALCTILLALRLYTGAVILGKLGLDAALIVLAWGVSLAFFIAMLLAMPSGFGKHLWDVTGQQLQGYLNLLLFMALTYIWPPTLTKLAILVLYHRINPALSFRICLYTVAFALVASTVVFTALFSGPCNPLATGSGTCLNNIAIAQAVINIVTDAAIILLPIPTIQQLKMPIKQKITVGALLVLGSGVIIASCVRVAYVRAMASNPDFTWTQASAAVWSSVELNIGIACNCLAALRPFVRRHMPWLSSIVGGSSANNGNSYNKQASGKSFSHWRGENSAHGYQLHSVDRPKNTDNVEVGHSKIIVVDEYRVQFDRKKEIGDASSTEEILDSRRQAHGTRR